MIFQFRIQIQGITQPLVWRKVAVPANFTFLRFHNVIQEVFGWEDEHLFEFRDKERQGKICISSPIESSFSDSKSSAPTKNAATIILSDLFTNNMRKLLYIYDFGDNWVHEITLEAITDDNAKIATCILGKGACPPEDCGGTYGYEEIKEIFATMPDGEQAEEYRDWLGLEEGEIWDANAFDLNKINTYLKQI